MRPQRADVTWHKAPPVNHNQAILDELQERHEATLDTIEAHIVLGPPTYHLTRTGPTSVLVEMRSELMPMPIPKELWPTMKRWVWPPQVFKSYEMNQLRHAPIQPPMLRMETMYMHDDPGRLWRYGCDIIFKERGF